MPAAVILDLDDTLIVERPAAAAAFAATAAVAARRAPLDADALVEAVRHRSHEQFYAGPLAEYCSSIAISSWEGLWCRYEGESAEQVALRDWAPGYRRASWRLALADLGVADDALAAELAERFGVERRARHHTYADARPGLAALRATGVPMGLLTNGSSCLQREKLEASGLGDLFDVIVVAGDRGIRKPDPDAFLHVASLLGADPAQTVMIGDNPVSDIEGALSAGMRPIWCDRDGARLPAHLADVHRITTMDELLAATVGFRRPS